MGGNTNAFYGLSGAGDLVLTCYSERSRNHTVGKRLGKGESLAEIIASEKTVAEGIPTARSAWECARKLTLSRLLLIRSTRFCMSGRNRLWRWKNC